MKRIILALGVVLILASVAQAELHIYTTGSQMVIAENSDGSFCVYTFYGQTEVNIYMGTPYCHFDYTPNKTIVYCVPNSEVRDPLVYVTAQIMVDFNLDGVADAMRWGASYLPVRLKAWPDTTAFYFSPGIFGEPVTNRHRYEVRAFQNPSGPFQITGWYP